MIEINNQTSFRVDKKLFTGIAKKLLKGENREREKISLAFVGKEDIKKLNKKYRGRNKPTDVLSFDFKSKIKNQKLSKELGLGEILICLDVVKENAQKYGNDFQQEMIKVFTHGILHLCGYDHEKTKKQAVEMEKIEKKYLSKILK